MRGEPIKQSPRKNKKTKLAEIKKKNKKVFPFQKDSQIKQDLQHEKEIVVPRQRSRQSSKLSKTKDNEERSNEILKQNLFALRRANKARR